MDGSVARMHSLSDRTSKSILVFVALAAHTTAGGGYAFSSAC